MGTLSNAPFPYGAIQKPTTASSILAKAATAPPQRNPKLDRWYLQGDNAFAGKGDHVMILEFTPDIIHYSAMLNTGEIIDSASFKARR